MGDRKSFRLDRPPCPSCGGCSCAAPRLVKSPGNLLRLTTNVLTALLTGIALFAMRLRCPGCGERFWMSQN